MGIVFGLVAAALYGTGDYLGGRATARGDVRRVLLASQSTAAVVAVVGVFVVAGTASGRGLAYGAAAGVASSLGLGLLYRALAIGRAGVVAPLTAVVGALVPLTWGLARGERPGTVAGLGVVLAIVAAGLVAREEDAEASERPAGVGIALAAGAVLGSGFVFYAAAPEDSGLWPILSARLVAVALVGFALLVKRGDGGVGDGRAAMGAGVADMLGTMALLAGVRTDLAVLVAAICALAPGFTVFWAMTLHHERIGRVQSIGVVLALIGLVTIAAG